MNNYVKKYQFAEQPSLGFEKDGKITADATGRFRGRWPDSFYELKASPKVNNSNTFVMFVVDQFFKKEFDARHYPHFGNNPGAARPSIENIPDYAKWEKVLWDHNPGLP